MGWVVNATYWYGGFGMWVVRAYRKPGVAIVKRWLGHKSKIYIQLCRSSSTLGLRNII